jgi:hypothetical protein
MSHGDVTSMSVDCAIVCRMTAVERIRPEGLVRSPAFSHVAVVPPGALVEIGAVAAVVR